MENVKTAIDTATYCELTLLLQEYYTHYGFMEGNELLDFLMKTLEKYQLNQSPKCIGTLPFRTETGLEAVLICTKRRAQSLLERLITRCLKGI